MTEQKASKLRFYWVAFMTGVYTFYASVKIILGPLFVSDFRGFVNRVILTWSNRLLNLIGVTINVTGQEQIPQEPNKPIIVMCNHTSLYDIPVSVVVLKENLRMLAKKELFKIPVFAAALRRGEFVSIDRGKGEQWLKDLEIAKQKMLDGIILWVAPEGTRSKNGQLSSFKRGAFQLALDVDALIVPLVIKNIYQVQAGDDLTLYLNRQVDVEVCPVIDAGDYSSEQRQLLVENVRGIMLKALGQENNQTE